MFSGGHGPWPSHVVVGRPGRIRRGSGLILCDVNNDNHSARPPKTGIMSPSLNINE